MLLLKYLAEGLTQNYRHLFAHTADGLCSRIYAIGFGITSPHFMGLQSTKNGGGRWNLRTKKSNINTPAASRGSQLILFPKWGAKNLAEHT